MDQATINRVEQGSRVVYAIGSILYNAVALSAPTRGFNAAFKRSGVFLNLIYLNEEGTPVKILAAPLLGEATPPAQLEAVADDLVKRDLRYKASIEATTGERDYLYAEKLAHVTQNPHTIGWKPYDEGDEIAGLRKDLAAAKAEAQEARDRYDEAFHASTAQSDVELFLALLAKPDVAAFVKDPANIDAIEKAAGLNQLLDLEEGVEAATSATNAVNASVAASLDPATPGAPSAADLDAMAADNPGDVYGGTFGAAGPDTKASEPAVDTRAAGAEEQGVPAGGLDDPTIDSAPPAAEQVPESAEAEPTEEAEQSPAVEPEQAGTDAPEPGEPGTGEATEAGQQ